MEVVDLSSTFLFPVSSAFDSLCLVGKNQRHGTLSVGHDAYKVTLADLPTVVETHKTLDGKTFYKSADVGQAPSFKPSRAFSYRILN